MKKPPLPFTPKPTTPAPYAFDSSAVTKGKPGFLTITLDLTRRKPLVVKKPADTP